MRHVDIYMIDQSRQYRRVLHGTGTLEWDSVGRKRRLYHLRRHLLLSAESVNRQFLRSTSTRTICAWKGVAHYYDLVVDGAVNPDAAWYYPYPKPLVNQIKAYIAFWNGVQIEA